MQRIMERTGCVLQGICVSLITAFVIALSLSSCTCQGEKEKRLGVGFINDIKNEVYYKNFKSLIWTDARKGMPLFNGDYIRTGDSSLASISIENENLILDENTLIKIEKKGRVGSENVSVELVILNGNISLESSPKLLNSVAVKRMNDGGLITEDLNKLIVKVPDTKLNAEMKNAVVELLYPCDEKIRINNPVFRWNGKINGTLRIYKEKRKILSLDFSNEESRQVELKDGSYEWDIQSYGSADSARCSFEIVSDVESLSPVKSRRRRIKETIPELSGKEDEDVMLSDKKRDEKSDIVKKRLAHIQVTIDRSIEHIRETKKGIDPAKIQNYMGLSQRLDELAELLQELKILQESLLLDVMKMNSPAEIVRYLNELEEIENNIKGIDKEIREVEKVVYQGEIKSLK